MQGSKRHILIMSSWYPNRLDPHVGNFVQRFAELLTREYEVSVIHTLGDRSVKQIEIVDEVIEGVRTVIAYHPVSINKFWHWWNQRSALRKCLNRIEDVDLVFGHVMLPRSFQFVKAKKYYNCQLVVMEHASYYRKRDRKKMNQLQRTLIKQSSRHIKQIVAVSEVLKEDMRSVFPTTKIEVIPNFVNEKLFTIAPNQPVERKRFVHISTLDPQTKNPRLLYQGFQKAIENGNKDIHLTIISDQMTGSLQQRAEQDGLQDYFSFIGPLTWREIASEMKNYHAVVLTSNYETFNIVLAEAWLTGLPVITTEVGIAKALDPNLGVLIPQNNPDALAHEIDLFSTGKYQFDPEYIRSYAEQFSKEKVFLQLKQLFERYFDMHD